jgi:hypothetical protein
MDFDDCVPLPDACLADLSCACLASADAVPAGGECRADGTGGLYVTIAYP